MLHPLAIADLFSVFRTTENLNMKTKREPLDTDIHLWRWSHKALMPDGTKVTFKGTWEAPRNKGGEAARQLDQSMRKKYPDAKWMHNRDVEPGNGHTFGPTWQRGKFLRPSPENVQADLPPNGHPDFKRDVTGG